MKQHGFIKFSLLGALVGTLIAATTSANAANGYAWPSWSYQPAQPVPPVYVPPPPSCPVGSFVVPGGAYRGPATVSHSAKLAERFSQFAPIGDLCVFPYDGPFAVSWNTAAAICDHGLMGGLQWRLPNEKELYEIFQRGFHNSLGMRAGTYYNRYWSSTLSWGSNKMYASYIIAPTSSRSTLISINRQPTNLEGIYIAFRCVKPAIEFVTIPVCPPGYSCNNGDGDDQETATQSQ
ncbi:MAG: DUF1566 domain-containing protein [Azoarcus sp.]|jgi:hypothetical protein|nr:DUF1566 domain-containing protein [Azoarcus sp.]